MLFDVARLRLGRAARRRRRSGSPAWRGTLGAGCGRTPRPPPTRAGAACTFSARSVRTSRIVAICAASAPSSASRSSPGRRRARGRGRRGAAACAKSRPCGVATCSSKSAPSRSTGRKWKMPPPSLLMQHDRRAAGRAGAPRAARRCRGRARRRRSAARSARRAAATPNAVETVPSIPLAPRLESTRGGRVAGGEEGLDVAHRHRGGDDERRLRRQPHAELGGHARLGQLRRASARSRRRPRGRRRARRRASSRSLRGFFGASARGSAVDDRADAARPGPARRPRRRRRSAARRGRAATAAAASRSGGRRSAARGRARGAAAKASSRRSAS